MVLDIKNIKIRIKDEKQSRAVQKVLFRLGAGWDRTNKTIIHTKSHYLYVDEEQFGFSLAVGNTETFFLDYEYREVTPEQILNQPIDWANMFKENKKVFR